MPIKNNSFFPFFFVSDAAGTATLWQNGHCSSVAAISTIIAVAAVVVAAVDGSSEGRQFAPK